MCLMHLLLYCWLWKDAQACAPSLNALVKALQRAECTHCQGR
jgi:hypothetical protein